MWVSATDKALPSFPANSCCCSVRPAEVWWIRQFLDSASTWWVTWCHRVFLCDPSGLFALVSSHIRHFTRLCHHDVSFFKSSFWTVTHNFMIEMASKLSSVLISFWPYLHYFHSFSCSHELVAPVWIWCCSDCFPPATDCWVLTKYPGSLFLFELNWKASFWISIKRNI